VLFRRLWPKLLKAAAVEAVAERPTADRLVSPTADAFEELFADAGRGREEAREVTERTRMFKREGERGVFFETRDMRSGGAWFHRNYLAK
jgi:hypothetical protein